MPREFEGNSKLMHTYTYSTCMCVCVLARVQAVQAVPAGPASAPLSPQIKNQAVRFQPSHFPAERAVRSRVAGRRCSLAPRREQGPGQEPAPSAGLQRRAEAAPGSRWRLRAVQPACSLPAAPDTSRQLLPSGRAPRLLPALLGGEDAQDPPAWMLQAGSSGSAPPG